MGDPMSDAKEKARRRIEQLEDLKERLRLRQPVTAEDVALERTRSVEAAERAEAAALGAADASMRKAEFEERVADLLADRDPDRAKRHRDQAEAARRRAEEERAEAALDRSIAQQRRQLG